MRRALAVLIVAALTIAFQGCSYARMDYEMRMADFEDILSFSPLPVRPHDRDRRRGRRGRRRRDVPDQPRGLPRRRRV
ncbi:MAG: hypothetical protein MZU97_11500 [Bacillus subtilis]|nr:hypothetical protein [Bacillus subtilis]